MRFTHERQRPVPQPLGGPLPGYPSVVPLLRLGEGIARKTRLGVDGVHRAGFVPLWRSPGGGNPGRGSGLADRLQDGPHVYALGDEASQPRRSGRSRTIFRRCVPAASPTYGTRGESVHARRHICSWAAGTPPCRGVDRADDGRDVGGRYRFRPGCEREQEPGGSEVVGVEGRSHAQSPCRLGPRR